MNIMTQNTIDEHGRIVEKDRLTHNQSYKWVSVTLVNSRVDKDNLLSSRFGACLKRFMNWTIAVKIFQERKFYPQKWTINRHTGNATSIQIWQLKPAPSCWRRIWKLLHLASLLEELLDPMNGECFHSLSVIFQLQSCRMLVGIQLRCVIPMAT